MKKTDSKDGALPRLFHVDKTDKKVPVLYVFKVKLVSVYKERTQK